MEFKKQVKRMKFGLHWGSRFCGVVYVVNFSKHVVESKVQYTVPIFHVTTNVIPDGYELENKSHIATPWIMPVITQPTTNRSS